MYTYVFQHIYNCCRGMETGHKSPKKLHHFPPIQKSSTLRTIHSTSTTNITTPTQTPNLTLQPRITMLLQLPTRRLAPCSTTAVDAVCRDHLSTMAAATVNTTAVPSYLTAVLAGRR